MHAYFANGTKIENFEISNFHHFYIDWSASEIICHVKESARFDYAEVAFGKA